MCGRRLWNRIWGSSAFFKPRLKKAELLQFRFHDLLPHIGQRLRSCVSVLSAIGSVDYGVVGYDRFLAVLTNRSRLESDSLCPFGVEYNALDVRSLDRLELGWL